MDALILAAGYGTRLYPLTVDKPKPLLDIAGRTILDFIIDNIARSSVVKRVVIVTNNKFCHEFEQWREQARPPLPVEIVNDGSNSNQERLGAIRDMQLAVERGRITSDLLVIGGDNLFDLELAEFAGFCAKHPGEACIAVHDIGDIEHAHLYGIVQLDASGRVIDFEEKPARPKTTFVAVCIYYFPAAKLGHLSQYLEGASVQDAPGSYIKWLAETDRVYAQVFKQKWFDIGDMYSYEQANNHFLQK